MHQRLNHRRPGSEPLLMAYLPRWCDYTPPGLWLAVRLQADPVPHTDLVGRSEHGIGAEAVIGAFEPARSLVDRSVATHMFASTVIGFVVILTLGLA